MKKDRQLEQMAIASLTEEDCPPSERVAAYALGMLTGNDHLSVAAHVRTCPLCTHDIAVCLPPTPRPRPVIAQLVPLTLLPGRRNLTNDQTVRRFVATDITIELTIAPPEGEEWRITGQISRADKGLADCDIVLRRGRWRQVQKSDEFGFFTFEYVPAGTYSLTGGDSNVQIQIQSLMLSLND